MRRELWESFVSLLRSYAGVASLDGKQYTVESFSDGANVQCQQRSIRFFFYADTGDAIWREKEASGTFHLNQDGTLEFANGPKAMDLAAIDWIEQLGRKENKL